MKIRIVHKHDDNCGGLLPENEKWLWYATGKTERHNAGGFGTGHYLWLEMKCNYTIGCPGKILVSVDDLVEPILNGEVKP